MPEWHIAMLLRPPCLNILIKTVARPDTLDSHDDSQSFAAPQLLQHPRIAFLLQLRIAGCEVDEVGAVRQNLIWQEAKIQACRLESQHSLVRQRWTIPSAQLYFNIIA